MGRDCGGRRVLTIASQCGIPPIQRESGPRRRLCARSNRVAFQDTTTAEAHAGAGYLTRTRIPVISTLSSARFRVTLRQRALSSPAAGPLNGTKVPFVSYRPLYDQAGRCGRRARVSATRRPMPRPAPVSVRSEGRHRSLSPSDRLFQLCAQAEVHAGQAQAPQALGARRRARQDAGEARGNAQGHAYPQGHGRTCLRHAKELDGLDPLSDAGLGGRPRNVYRLEMSLVLPNRDVRAGGLGSAEGRARSPHTAQSPTARPAHGRR